MNKLNECELAKIWYHSFMETIMSVRDKEIFKNMCKENEVKPSVVQRQIYIESLKEESEDDLKFILELVERHYDKVVKVMDEDDADILDCVASSISDDCDKYGVDPTDVILMIELEYQINEEGDK